jgi:hypothetical protein
MNLGTDNAPQHESGHGRSRLSVALIRFGVQTRFPCVGATLQGWAGNRWRLRVLNRLTFKFAPP